MTENHIRPDPDELLVQVQKEEAQRARGKLKIFLGYVAGVGKTYAMLEAAHQRRAEGVDLAAAYVETHGRLETETLLQGLEVIPRRPVEYRGVSLTEMDIDAVLARRPQLALVDELAHTNAPGSRHAKRYQDVQELLKAGIDVYTTVNIQHLESLNDVVAQITGVVVRETVPDRILDEAHEIELIDLPSDELLQRLQEGKVYVPEQAAQAMRKFFRPGNLSALRELALRRAADRVDEQLRAYMQSHAIPGPWPAGERLLVCVSPSPLSERLVRAGRRLAARLNTEWFAVYVETPGHVRLSAAGQERVAHTLQLAESLGARAVTLTGRSIAETLVTFARTHNVTRIVAGKPLRSRWVELWRGSIIDRIIRQSGDIDIYVISSSATDGPLPAIQRLLVKQPYRWRQYAQSMGLIAAATLLGYPLRSFVEPTNLVMLYLLAVVIAAVCLGRRPALLASLLSVVAFNYIFVPPYYTYVVSDAGFLLTFAALLIVGLVISTLAAQAREQARAAQRRETQTAALYELSRSLTGAVELKDIVETLAAHVGQTFSSQVAVLLPDPAESVGRSFPYPLGTLSFRLKPYVKSPGFILDQNEQAVATWVFQHDQWAGQGTDTLSGARAAYLPLKTARKVVGVLGVSGPFLIPLRGEGPAILQREEGPAILQREEANPILQREELDKLTPDQWRLLESFANQTAQAIERVQLAAEAGQAQLLRETENLQTALLNSISHDLRTPLASITGALSSLRDDAAFLDEAARNELINTAWEQADRLNNLVGNLLEMTRLEAGVMKVRPELCDVQDLIGAALAQLAGRLDRRPIRVEIPDDLPLVPMDFVLMVQVLVNLLDNAAKYSPVERPITIRAGLAGAQLKLEVIDQGPGIPDQELPRIFHKFYRGPGPNQAGGAGLGLSISQGIVEAHHGRIWAERRPEGGMVFTVALPKDTRSEDTRSTPNGYGKDSMPNGYGKDRPTENSSPVGG